MQQHPHRLTHPCTDTLQAQLPPQLGNAFSCHFSIPSVSSFIHSLISQGLGSVPATKKRCKWMGRSSEKGGADHRHGVGRARTSGRGSWVLGKPRGCCSWQMRWPHLGAVARLSLDVGSSRQRPRHAGAEPEGCALGVGAQRWVSKLGCGGSELWELSAFRHREKVTSKSVSRDLVPEADRVGRVHVPLNFVGLGPGRASGCYIQYLHMLKKKKKQPALGKW